MKNRTAKGIIAVFLALVLLAAPVLACMANAYEATVPTIEMRGFMSSTIYAVENDPESEQLWPPTTDKILGLVKNILGPLAKLSVNRDWDAFAYVLAGEVNNMLGDLWLDNNGDLTDNSGVYMPYPAEDEVVKDGEYEFVFDWRIDPYEAAAGLNDFVQYILEASGSDKVNIICHSYAGIVVTCYMEEFGCDAVRSVCYNSTAVYGAGFTKDIIRGKLFVGGDSALSGSGAESVIAYLLGAFSNNQYATIIDTVIDMVSKAGLIDFLSNFLNKLLLNSSDILYKESVAPLFGLWPAIWAMIPDEDFEEGLDCIFNDVLADTGEDYSGLFEKIDHYTESVREKREDVLNTINDNCNFYVISRYGYSALPLTTSWHTMTDGVLDTKATSFGATVSDYDVTDLFEVTNEYISPNGQIDASTCLFPEQTWFIRSASHIQHFPDIQKLAKELVCYDGQATVETFEQYPRFMYYSAATDSLIADPGISAPMTFIQKFVEFFKEFFALIFSIFKK